MDIPIRLYFTSQIVLHLSSAQELALTLYLQPFDSELIPKDRDKVDPSQTAI